MTRDQIINSLIEKFGYKTYLEIGVQKGLNFNKIKCDYKTGVDPSAKVKVDYPMTSDEFFKQNTKKYDCVFIDGLHEAEQVYKDIKNSLDILNEGGSIVCHDMNPQSEYMQRVPRPNEKGPWNGDCWKALVVAAYNFKIDFFTIDTDQGCAIIRGKKELRGRFEWLNFNKLTYEILEKERKERLNLISVEEFKQWLKK